MGRTTVRIIATAWAACSTIGCSTPTESLGRAGSSRLHVVINIVDSIPPTSTIPLGSALFSIQAFLVKGRDATGHERQVLSDTLQVLQWKLVPTRQTSNGELDYEAEFPYPREAIGSEPLTISPPIIVGVAADFPTLSWQTIRRLGPRDITLTSGADLILPLALPTLPQTPPYGDVRWTLAVLTAIPPLQVLQLTGSGLPPSSIHIDRALLPGAGASPLQALLSFFVARPDSVLTAGAYVVTPVIQTSLYWNIHFQ